MKVRCDINCSSVFVLMAMLVIRFRFHANHAFQQFVDFAVHVSHPRLSNLKHCRLALVSFLLGNGLNMDSKTAENLVHLVKEIFRFV